MEQKSLTTRGLVLPNFIFILINLGMIIVGAYLTNHYMDTFYPAGLKGASNLCNISEFWGCDKATLSPLGNIAGIPTSIFGLLMGVIGLVGALIGKKEIEQTFKVIFALNLLGCIVLFLYSLFALGGLCPMCTVYYILSALATFMLFKYSNLPPAVDVRVIGLIAVTYLIPVVGMSFHIGSKEKQKKALAQSYVKQFEALKDYGEPTVESPFRLHSSTEKFSDAKIRISIFSDFQCPYCAKAAELVGQIKKKYGDKVKVVFKNYPLAFHKDAFKAAEAGLCAHEQDKFWNMHDLMFAEQNALGVDDLKDKAKRLGLDTKKFNECLDSSKNAQRVRGTMAEGQAASVKSTPTFYVNGQLVMGAQPLDVFSEIIDEELAKVK